MSTLTLHIPYNRAHVSGVQFKTEIDGEYTANEQRNKLWTNPRRSWVLDFEKTKDGYQELEDFFILCGGRFRAFNWKWAATDKYGRPAGGNGVTYLVRFDTDEIKPTIDSLGGRFISIPIVQVVN